MNDDDIMRKLSCNFAIFVNHECMQNTLPKKLLKTLANCLRMFKLKPVWAEVKNSLSPTPFIGNFFDSDIFVDTEEVYITSEILEEMAIEIHPYLNRFFTVEMNTNITSSLTCCDKYDDSFHVYKFKIVDVVEFDIIFGNVEWTSPRRNISPLDSDFRHRPDRQRTVKLLKWLIKNHPTLFPYIPAIRLERLTMATSKEVDRDHYNHPHYNSGLLLFRTVLYQFYKARYAEYLIDFVEGLLPCSTCGRWTLDVEVYDKWSKNGSYLLASIHELRTRLLHDLSDFTMIFTFPDCVFTRSVVEESSWHRVVFKY